MRKKLAILLAGIMAISSVPVSANTYRDRNNVTVTTDATVEVRTAVWSDVNGQDDIHWYDNVPTPVGYNCVFSLENHTGTGLYHAHTYAFVKNIPVLLGKEQFIVDGIHAEPTFMVHVGRNAFDIVAQGYDAFDSLVVAVWSEKNGQDDLSWYWVGKDGTVAVPTAKHMDGSKLHFHLYGFNSEGQSFIDMLEA